MRKLTSGNKKEFAIFTIIIIAIITILVCCLNIALKIEKEEYVIESDNFLYDEAYNPISLEGESTIQKKWDGNYYLEDKTANEEYKLGKQSIAYQTSTKTINLYGEMYRIYTDGAVAKLSKNNVISKISEDQLYKLGDRQYMIIGNSISNQTGALSTTGYLLIILDKAGNTYLLNNELNSKTIKPMIINTQTFQFDVANEKLIYNEKEIDLKKIIGSTNQYVDPESIIEYAEEESTSKDIASIQNNIMNIQNDITYVQDDMANVQDNITNVEDNLTNVQDNIANVQNNISNVQNNITNIQDDIDELEENATNNNQSIIITETNNNGEEKTELAKSVTLRNASASSTYIDVEYNVIDPENKYQTVYLLVDGAEIAKTIALDKDENTYRVTGLKENQEYKITLASKQLNDEGEVEETIEDITVARTTKITSTLKITKITLSKIYFQLIIDQNQNIDEAEIVLYVDGEEKERTEVDIEKATTSSGWIGNLKYYYGKDILLKVENAKYNGKNITVDIQTKAKNY